MGLVEELAQASGIRHRVAEVPEADVHSADELMLTSATKEILAVTELDGRPVADGKPDRCSANCWPPIRKPKRRSAEAARATATEDKAA